MSEADFFATGARNQLQTLYDFVRLLMLDTCVQILFIFADNDQVQLRKVARHERRIRFRGANIGEQAHGFADCYVEAFIAAALRRSDWTFEEDFMFAEYVPRFGGDARAMAFEVETLADADSFVVELRACSVENTEDSVHDFGPDAVAFGYCDSWFC